MKNICLYLHIPFCSYKCHYCAFAVHVNQSDDTKQRYVNTLCNELDSKLSTIMAKEDIHISSIYIGGGTPNSLSIRHFEQIFNTLNRNFNTADTFEISCECAPQEMTKSYARDLKSLGVNRITIGIETFSDTLRKKLARFHAKSEFDTALQAVRNAGFSNVGSDIIIGLPEEDSATMTKDIKSIATLGLEHVSIYMLVHEPDSNLGKMKNVCYPADGDIINAYHYAQGFLSSNRYEQYEISNWSRGGNFNCLYNTHTWEGGEFLGFGISAASFWNGQRFENTRNLKTYIAMDQFNIPKAQKTDPKKRQFELVMMGLRRPAGVDLEVICDPNLVSVLDEQIEIKKTSKKYIYTGSFTLIDRLLQDIYNSYFSLAL